MRGLMGTFAFMPIADLVEVLGRRKISGDLTCERGTVRKTVSLVEGVAVGASSNDPREYLGQLLMNFGHLTEEDLAKAFETQQETKVRLGKVLAMVGLVSAEVLKETLALKIRETLLDAFLWDSGWFRVEEAPRPELDELAAEVALSEIASEAEFRTTAWQAFRARFPTGAATLVLHEERVPRALAPGSIDGKLIALAREGKSIDELGLALHATDFHLYQRLYALQQHGILDAAPVEVPRWIAGDAAQAGEHLDRARVLAAEGRTLAAEEAAVRALELAPGLEAAGALVEDLRSQLASSLRAQLLEPPRRPRLKVAPRDIALMRLSASEKYLLGRCDGVRNVRQLVQLAPLSELEVLKAVQKFVEARIVELG